MVQLRVYSGFFLVVVQLAFVRTEFLQHLSETNPEAKSDYTSCEENFSSEKFSIILPKSEKPEPFECRFLVSAFTPDVCRLRINFKKFVLASSPSCRDEFLLVGGRRLCGSILGVQLVPFPDATSVIYYRGDGDHPLQIEVEQVRCKLQVSGNLCDVTTSSERTEISSPNYPSTYPTPITCLYTILTRPQETCQLLIKFHDFVIPDSPDCLKGRLLIDGKAYCGNKTGWLVAVNASEEFRFEFSAGSGQSSGSFRVSVSQVPCERQDQISNNASASQVGYFPPVSPFPPQCCGKVFNSPSFILTSPGFFDLTTPLDFNCIYHIVPASPTTCRIRFNFLHFWLGQEDIYYGCADGFLEIDGRRFCGCKDGLVIDTYFRGGRKELLFSTRGERRKGFVIEVHQEDCVGPRGRSIPEEVTINPDNEVEVFSTNSTVEKVTSRFLIPNDDSRCHQWGLSHWLDKVQAILRSLPEQCPVPPAGSLQPGLPINPIIPPPYPPSRPVPPIVYPPNYPLPQPPIVLPPSPPSRPVPPIIPPSSYPLPQPPILPPSYPPPRPFPPIIPPPNVFPTPQPPIYPRPNPPIVPPLFPPRPVPPICPPILQPPVALPQPPLVRPPLPRRCIVTASTQGGFQSPGYPWSYPPDQKCCYRIRQAPGFCRLQLTVLDFDLVWSPKCWKDYLLLDQRVRYCSRALQSTVSYLPFRNGFASVDFVSDSFLSSRGFRAVFRQIPCSSFPFLPRSDFDSTGRPQQPLQPQQPQQPLQPPVTAPPNSEDGFELNVTPVR